MGVQFASSLQLSWQPGCDFDTPFRSPVSSPAYEKPDSSCLNHMSFMEHNPVARREFLSRCGMGMGSIGLTMANAGASSTGFQFTSPQAPKQPHFAPRAKRVIHLFMNGGPSQVDSFDPKPALDRYAGKMLPMDYLPTERKTGTAFPSPFKFRNYGRGGIPVSELFPNVAECADDLCVVRSMIADLPNHEPSLLLMNCGNARQALPSLGSWVTYGLGTENQNLPGFVVMCPGGYPVQGPQNWQSGFLPGAYQGTYIDSRHRDLEKLVEHVRNKNLRPDVQRAQLDFVQRMNARHVSGREDDSRLEARIHSFELAYRMQMDASDAFDVSREPQSIRELYGDDVQGRQMLIARRLLERGVRFVQVWHGERQPWDSHEELEQNHRKLAGECDQAIAALLKDLKQRGMLEDTLVIWGGEFGRTPTVELPTEGFDTKYATGRDHDHYGFSIWLAGAGVKAGHIHGATDEFGFRAVEKPIHVHDLHATILHLLGFDHERLTFRHAGRDFRLTDVYGRVQHELLA